MGEFLFLGTSGSMGVPVIACSCPVCLSSNPLNKRKRCAAIIKIGDNSLLIDAGPEIRQQLLSSNIHRLDGVILTHAHYDHIAGFDDLKAFCFAQKQKLPVLLSRNTFDEIRLTHYYLLEETSGHPQGIFFDFNILDELFGSVEFTGIPLEFVSYYQTGMPVIGLKIGNLAYISDIKDFSEKVVQSLRGTEILILSALKHSLSPMHLCVDDAIALAKRIGARQTYFTHMSHEVDYEKDSLKLPSGFAFAYDGLKVPFTLKY